MKSSGYTEEQIIGILKQHQAGLAAKELCRKYGISDATFYKWWSKYGSMEVSDAPKLKALEEGEPHAEEVSGGDGAGCDGAERDAGKKLLPPRARRVALGRAIKNKGYAQRRACRLAGAEDLSLRLAATGRRCPAAASERTGFGT
jgi:predicted DNA-binding transcriptional regulator AlpA